ncbi:MAG: hypothetical protein GY926_01680 [bacterium]|nr:hypothetical protein [bacterium]
MSTVDAEVILTGVSNANLLFSTVTVVCATLSPFTGGGTAGCAVWAANAAFASSVVQTGAAIAADDPDAVEGGIAGMMAPV